MKEYLGDSVYADFENGMVKLTTENGMGPSNTIYLEPEVMRALIRYAESRKNPAPKCAWCGGAGCFACSSNARSG
jgi:hypothetical protein